MMSIGTGNSDPLINVVSTACRPPDFGAEMAGPDIETILRVVGGPEEGEAVDVVDMGVRQENMRAQPFLTGRLDPSKRMPVPASKIRRCWPQVISMQEVLPP